MTMMMRCENTRLDSIIFVRLGCMGFVFFYCFFLFLSLGAMLLGMYEGGFEPFA